MAIRDLWRKLTRRGKDADELDLRPEHDKLLTPTGPLVYKPPMSEGLEKPKH